MTTGRAEIRSHRETRVRAMSSLTSTRSSRTAQGGELSEQAAGRRSAPSGCDRPGLRRGESEIDDQSTQRRPPRWCTTRSPRPARAFGNPSPGPLLARSRTLGASRRRSPRVQGGRRAAPVHRGPRAEPRFFRDSPGDGGGGGGPRSAAVHHERRSRDADHLSAPRRLSGRTPRAATWPPPGRAPRPRPRQARATTAATLFDAHATTRAARPVAGRVGRGSGASLRRERRGGRGRGDERT